MVLTPKPSNLLPSGYALLQLFTAAFRSNDPDTSSEDDDDSMQKTDNDDSCSTKQAQRHDVGFQTDSSNTQHDNQDKTVSCSRLASHDASHGNPNQTTRSTTSGFLLGSPHDKDAITQKLREAFGYSEDEMLIEEYSCWMARSVLLPGYMYLTTNHICFYANLPSSHDVVQKEGYFSKKSSTTKTLNRYWFVLKNDMLSYYKDQSDIYYPIKTIDLKDALSAEPSLADDLAFNVHTRSRKHKFKTDSEMARSEWVKAIQKSIFHAKMDEDNVKISIPLANVMVVELNTTSFTDTIRLEIKDMDDIEDEFYFAYFEDTPKTQAMLESKLDEYRKTSTGNDQRELRFMDSTSPAPHSHRKSLATEQPQGPLASSLSGPQQSETSQSASGVSRLLSPLKYLRPSYAFSDGKKENPSVPRTSPEIGRKGGAKESDEGTPTNPLARGPVTWAAEHSPDVRSGSSGGIQMIDADQQLAYNKEFSLPEGESLAETFSGYLLRVLPVYGKIYLSDNYVCFKSTMYGSSTKVVLPLADVMQVEKHHGTRFYFHGLAVSVKTGEEIFFEFSDSETRSTALKALRDRITPEAQERRKEYRAQAVRETTALELDDPMESRVMDSLQLREEPIQGEPMSLALHPSFRPSRPLHITCLTIGSRGDVQPYIALCKRLMEDGHTCRIATHGEYKDWVEGHGIEFGYVGGDPGELIELCVDNGMFTVSFIREGLKRFRGWLDDLMNTAWSACQNTDVLIESPSAMAGIHIAEALDIPYFRALPFPWTRTRAFPHPFAVPERNLGRGYNYMTYAMIEQVFWKGISGQINKWRRRKLGLPSTSLEKMDPNRVPCLYSWSPSLVPAPMDWHSWIHVTGYWFLDNPDLDWTPPEGLEEFMDAEPDNKPVYIGFGSMVVADPEDMTKTIVDAVIKAGVRAVICKGWSDKLSTQDSGSVDVVQESSGEKRVYPSSVYMIKSVPHDWLFPRVAGVVHHGGAGTTAAGLRAGIPTVIKPYFGDQYFWAQRVEDAGVGVWCHDLTVKKLAAALETITKDQKMIQKAQIMGETIRTEDGVGKAVQYFYHDLVLAKQQLEKRKTDKEKADKDNRTTIASKVRAVASSVAVSSGNNEQENSRWLPSLSMTRRSKDGDGDGCSTEKDEQLDSRFSVCSIRASEEATLSGCAHDTQHSFHSTQEGNFHPRPPSETEVSTRHSIEPEAVHTTQRQGGYRKNQVVPGSPAPDDCHESTKDGSGDSESDSQLDGQQVKKSKARRVLGSLASKAKKVKDHLRSPDNLNDNAKYEHCAGEGLKEE